MIFTLRGSHCLRALGGGRRGLLLGVALLGLVHRIHACTWVAVPTAFSEFKAAKLVAMAAEAPDTWRSKLSGSADRRGIPLGTIVVTVVVVIGLLDLNAALILGLWVLRTIVLYVVIAFFFTLLMTPATRFLRTRGLEPRRRHPAGVPGGRAGPHRPGLPVHRAARDGGAALRRAGPDAGP